KTHPRVRALLDGGERVAWGAKTIPEGGFVALPKQFHAPGLLLCGDGVGLVNVPALKGIHYAIESGRLAAEAAGAGSLEQYDEPPHHIRIQTVVPRDLAEMWVNLCPAQVYELGAADADADRVHVQVAPSNCVQCGAITAKGGRLTPPEGGSGPEYTLT